MNLIDAIQRLGTCDFDTLRDIRDLLEFQSYNDKLMDTEKDIDRKRLRRRRNQIKLRIRGRHSHPRGSGKTWDQITYPDSLETVPKLSSSERAVLYTTALQLIEAKRPVVGLRNNEQGRVARGSFQVKTKKDAFTVRDKKGNPLRDKDGKVIKKDAHYLYLRVYMSSHDGTKRNASIYIGSLNRQEPKPFISAVYAGRDAQENGKPIEDYMITREQIIDTFSDGGYDAIKAWRKSMDDDYDPIDIISLDSLVGGYPITPTNKEATKSWSCSNCGQKIFIEPSEKQKCAFCGKYHGWTIV